MTTIFKTAVSLVFAALAFSSRPATDETEESLGIEITKCDYDEYGVTVEFETDLKPPYVVGVYPAADAGFPPKPHTRARPIRWKLVDGTRARLSGDFISRGTSFVQVFTPDITNSVVLSTNETPWITSSFRQATSNELERYYREFNDARLLGRQCSAEAADEQWEPWWCAEHMTVIGDHEWGCFVRTNLSEIALSGNARGFCTWHVVTNRYQTAVEGWEQFVSNKTSGTIRDWHVSVMTNLYADAALTNAYHRDNVTPLGNSNVLHIVTWYEPWLDFRDVVAKRFRESYDPAHGVTNYEAQVREFAVTNATFGPFDTSVGSGFRIRYFDDRDEFSVVRAYSLFTNCSQEVALRKPFKTLSRHGDLRLARDFYGNKVFVAETNAVPDRIYWEGLR